MYAWIWRRLPGTWPVKTGVALGLAAVVAAILWFVVFPWAEPKLQFDQGVVHNGPATPTAPAGNR